MEQLIAVAVLMLLSVLSSWLQNRRAAEDPKGDGTKEPQRSKLEEFLRSLTDENAQKTPPPLAMPIPRRSETQLPPTSKREAELARQSQPSQPARSSSRTVPAGRSSKPEAPSAKPISAHAKESAAAALRRAEQSHSDAVELAQRLRRQAERRLTAGNSTKASSTSATARRGSTPSAPVRSWLSEPATARQAILASAILSPPKALE